MRYLYDDDDIKKIHEEAWDAGFNIGAALAAGLVAVGFGIWALVTGVAS